MANKLVGWVVIGWGAAVLLGCGSESSSSKIQSCSPVGSKICGSDNRLYECRGPGSAGGDADGEGVLIDDCPASGKVCDGFSSTSSCTTKEAYCAKNITPKPDICK